MERRSFINLLGKGTLAVTLLPYMVTSSCGEKKVRLVKGILPTIKDDVILASGLTYQTVVSWGDKISDKDTFGFNNDFLCFIPLEGKTNEGILWSNHEYPDPLFIHGNTSDSKTKEEVDLEMYNTGGGLLHIKKNGEQWEIVYNSEYNRKVNGFAEIPFNWDESIFGANKGIGTLGNCAGGLTPWGTVLTCEENYQDFYSDRNSKGEVLEESWLKWDQYYPNHIPEHYGWVVEVDPKTGKAQKQIALGRCSHECATVVQLPDERVVVYTGDDKADECLYKFISSKPNSLKEGTLYVANTKEGKWIPIDVNLQPELMEAFKTQTQTLIFLREAAVIVGGTPLDRPEDIEVDPVDGSVLVSLTNNKGKENYFGSILKLVETDNNYESLTFSSSTYLAGGEEAGFACPDNMIFDRKGNLWFASDISGSKMNQSPYEAFKNNGLFLVLREGEQAGEVIQVASAPVGAEFTGLWFSPDNKTLFVSVQHPGEYSKSIDELTSHWPNGGDSIPRPSVIAIGGEFLHEVQGLV